MRIVKRKEFLGLPDNTVYAEYSPCVFGDLMIKVETYKLSQNDFTTQQIVDAIDSEGSEDFFNKLEQAEESGISLEMDFDCTGRDGCIDDADKLYAVFEQKDIAKLIKRLQDCLST